MIQTWQFLINDEDENTVKRKRIEHKDLPGALRALADSLSEHDVATADTVACDLMVVDYEAEFQEPLVDNWVSLRNAFFQLNRSIQKLTDKEFALFLHFAQDNEFNNAALEGMLSDLETNITKTATQ